MTYINDTWLMSHRMVKAPRRVGGEMSDFNLDTEVRWNNENVGEAWEDASKAWGGFKARN